MRQTAITAALLFASLAAAQQTPTTPARPTLRELKIENIFDPKSRVAFSGAAQSGFVWLDDKTFTWPRTDEKNEFVEQAVFDTQTGTRRVLFDAAKMRAAARKMGGVTEEERGTAQPRRWNFSPSKKSLVLTIGDDLYLYSLDSETFTRLTFSPGR